MSEKLLEVHNATKIYKQGKRDVVALQDFNLTLDKHPASIVTIAGESGSGKSTLAKLVLGFEKLSSGRILFEGQDMTRASTRELKEYRRKVQAVFQDPFGVFNPYYRVEHVFEMVSKNFRLFQSDSQSRDHIEEALNVVGLQGEAVLRKYPHQLSGGQRQRIMIARAYLLKPKLIVADEPVSMVDASLRASILDVMIRLRDEEGISFLYITHDLSTAYQVGDQIFMFYQGAIAETGNATDVITHPQHPYVQLLIDSVPKPDPNIRWQGDIELPPDEEMRTSSKNGCRFYPRCPKRMNHCESNFPQLYQVGNPGHEASCFLFDGKVAGTPAPSV